MIPWLQGDEPFPPVEKALDSPNGLLCAGGDLSPGRLVAAYARGIFPWFSEAEPILWWSPDPRMVLFPEDLKVSRSLRKRVDHGTYELTVDTAFRRVMQECARPRSGQSGTWIVPDMIDAYTRLHEAGLAHSVEAWREGRLVGGLYGVALGRVFYGESMFSRSPDASKVALVELVRRLREKRFRLIDCQQATTHLASLGAREIPRARFARLLQESIQYPLIGERWSPPNGSRG
jgi:leucyl/phenylalanyl-tRNA--protein transferase